jgi:hypothetical protein
MLKKIRQLIESVNAAEGVSVRVAQRLLALAAAIWHNFRTGQAISRSLTAYDH